MIVGVTCIMAGYNRDDDDDDDDDDDVVQSL
jgi:hypothetical protein